jgi:hypothetical protein
MDGYKGDWLFGRGGGTGDRFERTCFLEFFIAMTAAIKKVLSPISEARMTPHDLKKPSKNRLDIVLECAAGAV